MKHSFLKTTKALLIYLLCLSVTLRVFAQNTSYNSNSIPIAGTNCTAFGTLALSSNTVAGNGNTGIGFVSLRFNTSGVNNTASGSYALGSNTTGSNNTANGVEALYTNTTGNYNTANGSYSLNSNIIGSFNTANGYQSSY